MLILLNHTVLLLLLLITIKTIRGGSFLDDHDLLDLLFHLHDRVHHGQLGHTRLLLLGGQTLLHKFKLLFQHVVLLDETGARLRVGLLVDRTRLINSEVLLEGRDIEGVHHFISAIRLIQRILFKVMQCGQLIIDSRCRIGSHRLFLINYHSVVHCYHLPAFNQVIKWRSRNRRSTIICLISTWLGRYL